MNGQKIYVLHRSEQILTAERHINHKKPKNPAEAGSYEYLKLKKLRVNSPILRGS